MDTTKYQNLKDRSGTGGLSLLLYVNLGIYLYGFLTDVLTLTEM